ncbi:MAG: nucleoside-diphosphate kinase, partial [Gammaproteobacteria bacterium]|nr:nucleoside-diphosphate kinase [Gammaproteobacteria bacterium]
MTDKTLAIIKPDAVKRNLIGKIINIIEENDFVVNQVKSYHLKAAEAETFYEIHKEKVFFESLIDYMTSDKIIVL